MEYEIGATYIVNHSRKGKFALRVDSQDDEWLTGEVVGGTAKAIMDYNIKEKGDPITVRKSFLSIERKAA